MKKKKTLWISGVILFASILGLLILKSLGLNGSAWVPPTGIIGTISMIIWGLALKHPLSKKC